VNEEFDFSTGMPSDEMSQYLQMYLDETAEQLDALVESLLVLEVSPTDAEQLNEAFRLIHSIKGSSAMMGLEGITVLTHHLENHFERLRSGLRELDDAAMGLILRCIDFLRECNRRLRAGEALASAPELLDELNLLSAGETSPPREPAAQPQIAAPAPDLPQPASEQVARVPVEPSPPAIPDAPTVERDYRITVRFEQELPLADLKAELVLARLADVARVNDTRRVEASAGELRELQITLSSANDSAELRTTADVDGVEFVDIEEGVTDLAMLAEQPPHPAAIKSAVPEAEAPLENEAAPEESSDAAAPVDDAVETPDARPKVAETVRVDIDRLDNLMNLAGELVVNKARFVQIARQMSPAFRKSGASSRARSVIESLRRALQLMKAREATGDGNSAGAWHEQIHDIESDITLLEEQAQHWELGRRCFGQFTEAIDQMARVSNNLQRGVLDTRMVPVAPLFNRFKRVVRDIAHDLGKRVQLEIRGEKTELDKRMIDELGDPLVHLVRNAVDHGIEPAEVRARRGKPETGVLRLEAAHSGNNVLISVRDDGEGINVKAIRQRVIERGLVAPAVAEQLSDRDLIDYIWHPGFSTAATVSDISGRGVGMDIVKTRIAELNGTIDVHHAAGRGTTFTIRLPLTLAIIHSLLFRLRHGMFAVPIDNIREIVSVPVSQIVTVHRRKTFSVRGVFIPLVEIDDIFDWHGMQYHYPGMKHHVTEANGRSVNVVILHSADKTIGLKVDELQGAQDIVIKSLAENFMPIRGLSGASILGDGSVCLLLDVGAVVSMASDPRRKAQEV
jgi:two-component system chemotaxis sensor kinase CheA